jgi:hypothetical protein
MLPAESQIGQLRSPVMQDTVSALPAASLFPISVAPTSISYALYQPISEIAVQFFFANYTCDEPPLSAAYHAWLTQAYYENPPNHALREIIEAAGMAGISNIYYAPQVASKSKEQYGRALAATNRALNNSVESVTDTTLMAVILLGLFEVFQKSLFEVCKILAHLHTVRNFRKVGSPSLLGCPYRRRHGPATASWSKAIRERAWKTTFHANSFSVGEPCRRLLITRLDSEHLTMSVATCMHAGGHRHS